MIPSAEKVRFRSRSHASHSLQSVSRSLSGRDWAGLSANGSQTAILRLSRPCRPCFRSLSHSFRLNKETRVESDATYSARSNAPNIFRPKFRFVSSSRYSADMFGCWGQLDAKTISIRFVFRIVATVTSSTAGKSTSSTVLTTATSRSVNCAETSLNSG